MRGVREAASQYGLGDSWLTNKKPEHYLWRDKKLPVRMCSATNHTHTHTPAAPEQSYFFPSHVKKSEGVTSRLAAAT